MATKRPSLGRGLEALLGSHGPPNSAPGAPSAAGDTPGPSTPTKHAAAPRDEELARIPVDLSLAGTCTNQNGSSIIDFFVVSEDLAEIAEGARTVVTACTAPCRPVSVTLRVEARQLKKLAVVPAQKQAGLRTASVACGLGGDLRAVSVANQRVSFQDQASPGICLR